MDETKLINDIFLTKEEISEALSDLYDEYGKSITLWDNTKKTEEISKYWKNKGKLQFEIS